MVGLPLIVPMEAARSRITARARALITVAFRTKVKISRSYVFGPVYVLRSASSRARAIQTQPDQSFIIQRGLGFRR